MEAVPIRVRSDDDPAHPPRRRLAFAVSDDLHDWLRVQARSREQSVAGYVRGTLHAVKRQQERGQ